MEEDGLCLDVPSYGVSQHHRSDASRDREGGGIAIFIRKRDGLVFRSYDPDIDNPAHVFVRSNRAWTKVEFILVIPSRPL